MHMLHRSESTWHARRDITEQVKTAMEAVERAVGRAYEVAGELGLEGDGAVAVGPNGSLRDCSLKEAARVLAGWHPRSPPDVAAEYYHHGTCITRLWGASRELLASSCPAHLPMGGGGR